MDKSLHANRNMCSTGSATKVCLLIILYTSINRFHAMLIFVLWIPKTFPSLLTFRKVEMLLHPSIQESLGELLKLESVLIISCLTPFPKERGLINYSHLLIHKLVSFGKAGATSTWLFLHSLLITLSQFCRLVKSFLHFDVSMFPYHLLGNSFFVVVFFCRVLSFPPSILALMQVARLESHPKS